MAKWEVLYYTPRNPSSLGGVRSLARSAGKNVKQTEQWLRSQAAYTLHKPVRYNFPRRKVITGGIGIQYQADLIDLSKLSKFNNGFKFILTIIDVFSKLAFAIPIKSKSSDDVLNAFKRIKDKLPLYLQTDLGTEFVNRKMQAWLRKNNVNFFTTQNLEIKASIIERWNRTLKNKLWRYFTRYDTSKYVDVLEEIVAGYNNSFHRSIGMPPNKVTHELAPAIWRKMYSPSKPYKTPKFNIGDQVRLNSTRRVFKKGYLPQWTLEIFSITDHLNTQPPTYTVSDWHGEILQGTFYEQELQLVNKSDDVYKIDSILKTLKHKVFVSWKGYPDTFNSWVNKKDLVAL